MTWAYGKVILLGEHAVVYGHPCLAGAIDKGVRCTLPQGQERLTLAIPQLDLVVTGKTTGTLSAAFAALQDAFTRVTNANLPTGTITADFEIPVASGLGSSAALAVAITRTFAASQGCTLTPAMLAEIANAGEACIHHRPSGVDVALASRGGLGLFQRERSLVPLEATVDILVGLTNVSRNTGDLVGHIARQRKRSPSAIDKALAGLGHAARLGRNAIEAGDITTLGHAMTESHTTLATLGVSCAALDKLVNTALERGSPGAKLTGAGGGGAIVAIPGDDPESILSAWRDAGFGGFRCTVGGAPPTGDHL